MSCLDLGALTSWQSAAAAAAAATEKGEEKSCAESKKYKGGGIARIVVPGPEFWPVAIVWVA